MSVAATKSIVRAGTIFVFPPWTALFPRRRTDAHADAAVVQESIGGAFRRRARALAAPEMPSVSWRSARMHFGPLLATGQGLKSFLQQLRSGRMTRRGIEVSSQA